MGLGSDSLFGDPCSESHLHLAATMTEDPVKYEPLDGQTPLREWDPVAAQADMYDRIERLEGVALDRPEPAYAAQQIRIEALRLSVDFHGRLYASMLSQGDMAGCLEEVRANIKQDAKEFAAYLESGE